jgi:hypothetical protein
MLLAVVRKVKVLGEERARRSLVLPPLSLQLQPRVTTVVMVAAGATTTAGGAKAEHRPAEACCWRLVLGLDTGVWDG